MKTSKIASMASMALVATLALGAVGCGKAEDTASSQPAETKQSQAATITVDQAKEAALADAKVKAKDATFTKVELGDENGTQVYDVEFTAGDTEYTYKVDAASGSVVSFASKAIAASTDTTATEQKQETTTETSAPVTNAPAATTNQDNYIGEDAALAKALEHAGINSADVSYPEIELDLDDGTVHYDVDFHVGQTEYNYDIDAVSGAVITYESEIDD